MDVLIDLAAATFLGILSIYVGTMAISYHRRTILARQSHDIDRNLLQAQIGLISDRRRVVGSSGRNQICRGMVFANSRSLARRSRSGIPVRFI